MHGNLIFMFASTLLIILFATFALATPVLPDSNAANDLVQNTTPNDLLYASEDAIPLELQYVVG